MCMCARVRACSVMCYQAAGDLHNGVSHGRHILSAPSFSPPSSSPPLPASSPPSLSTRHPPSLSSVPSSCPSPIFGSVSRLSQPLREPAQGYGNPQGMLRGGGGGGGGGGGRGPGTGKGGEGGGVDDTEDVSLPILIRPGNLTRLCRRSQHARHAPTAAAAGGGGGTRSLSPFRQPGPFVSRQRAVGEEHRQTLVSGDAVGDSLSSGGGRMGRRSPEGWGDGGSNKVVRGSAGSPMYIYIGFDSPDKMCGRISDRIKAEVV